MKMLKTIFLVLFSTRKKLEFYITNETVRFHFISFQYISLFHSKKEINIINCLWHLPFEREAKKNTTENRIRKGNERK